MPAGWRPQPGAGHASSLKSVRPRLSRPARGEAHGAGRHWVACADRKSGLGCAELGARLPQPSSHRTSRQRRRNVRDAAEAPPHSMANPTGCINSPSPPCHRSARCAPGVPAPPRSIRAACLQRAASRDSPAARECLQAAARRELAVTIHLSVRLIADGQTAAERRRTSGAPPSPRRADRHAMRRRLKVSDRCRTSGAP